MNQEYLKISGICKTFADGTNALKPVNLGIKKGEVLVLLGSSGCGKSTLLRIISGLEKPSGGEIFLCGEKITEIEPEKRDFGFVFQHYSLFPTMTVAENIAFGLKLRKRPQAEQHKRIAELLEMMNITELKNRKPAQLSGGQQQRVAVARALAMEPKVLLMDEPLTALDARLKEKLKIELARLFRQLKLTTVYVTHDQNEAMTLADTIGVMNAGVIEQIATPQEIYHHPKTPFVAQFIGQINKITGQVRRKNGDKFIDFGFYRTAYRGEKENGLIEAYIRPEDIRVASPGQHGCCALIRETVFLGESSRLLVEAGGQLLQVHSFNDGQHFPGMEIHLKIKDEKIIYL